MGVQIIRMNKNLSEGRTIVPDEERTGLQRTSTTNDDVRLVGDLTQGDRRISLWVPLTKYSGGQDFSREPEVQQAFLTWLHNLDADFDGLVYRWNKWLDKYDEYWGN
ncbi:hypothetical protein TNCV_4266851 [Trichonephila clavipes]|nr:hypothetical protein TNCV_4266851 [Trichonephila clavipes]